MRCWEMAETKLQRECAKYLSSEGIYYRKTANGLLACVRGQFVVFEFKETDPPRKLTASGGLIYRPRSLQGFVGTIRDIQSKTISRK